MQNHSSKKLMSDINVTPLVDVMLVLLIIFMVAAPMMVQGIDVNLPRTRAKALPGEEERLVITINRKGEILLDEYRVGVEELPAKLKRILENRTFKEVLLRADEAVPYGTVMKVMGEVKGAGVEKLGMVTEPPREDKKGDRKP
jgi:biopolymer transport protein TolR